MINTNGYYLLSPSYYEDVLGGNMTNGFFHNAYYFFENGFFLTAVKKSKSPFVIFSKEDFIKDQFNKFFISKNEIKMVFNYNQDWKHEEKFMIYNEEIICNDKKVLISHIW